MPEAGPATEASTNPSPAGPAQPSLSERIATHGRGLRALAARGTIVNAAFQVGIVTLGLLKGVVVAAFLTRAEYGVWGVLVISLLTISWLKQVGINDKYVQQSEDDQERAFQKAFTLELMFGGAIAVVFALLLPLLAVIYGEPRLIAPGLVLAAAAALAGFQAPAWVFYRRMDFVRQRVLQGIDPLLGFVVTLGLAAAGAGYWSLVAGALAGALAGAAACVLTTPIPLRLSFEGATARTYFSFSWPLVLAGASSLVIAQSAIIAGDAKLGLAGAGAITLAATVAHYSDHVDGIVSATLYPVICAMRDRSDLLFESFVKSNRLALMWGVPFGVGVSLFASDLVNLALGKEWRPAIILLQVFGLTAAAGHIGFNWHAYYRAIGRTRPIAVWSALTMLVYLGTAIPLVFVDGLRGLAIGTAIMTAVSLVIRTYYLSLLFPRFQMTRHAARAIAPTVPAVAAVLLARALEPGGRSAGMVAAELALYVAVTVAATVVLERALLSEVLRYLRRAPAPLSRATG